MDIECTPPAAQAVFFEAEIVPHRSLSPRALRRLLAAICGACGLSALVFVHLGAWPVGGFTGAELLLAAWLFRHNARSARAREVLLLSDAGLRVVRTDPAGHCAERTLPPAWLQVELEDRPGRVPGLLLRARDECEEVAVCLGEAEKRDLAEALARALYAWRHPQFDNPQLREEATAPCPGPGT